MSASKPTELQHECFRLLRDELDAAVTSGNEARIQGTIAAAIAYLETISADADRDVLKGSES
jgi:hypothetical protein